MKNLIYITLLILGVSCQKGNNIQESESKELKVLTVNYPLYFFTETIATDKIALDYLIPSDIDPAYWQPSNEVISKYQNADVIFLNGANYAKWVNKVSLPSKSKVDLSTIADNKIIKEKEGVAHSHGSEGEHVHYHYAITTWLDFEISIAYINKIAEELSEKLPANKEVFSKNASQLINDMKDLDTRMKAIGKSAKNYNYLGSHPVYQYLSKAYDLEIKSVHFEPNEMPSEKQWKKLESLLSVDQENIMLWEGKPMEGIQKRLEDMGVTIVVFNPCGNKSEERNFLEVMDENVQNLERSINIQ